jgi:phospholipid/cholesterol/gamma-HCH transport system substrate-binding protein
VRLVVATVAVLALASGACSAPDVADLPLPGGAPDGPAYRVTAEFADVLDLVPQAAVKVDDVTVGSVEKISLSGWTARLRLRVGRDVTLPANATAAVRQTSLLGEKYVALAAPTTEAPRGRLADGDVVPLARTRRAAEVEEVLAALGLLLNGGGLAHLRTINQELGTALDGREEAARGALSNLDTFIGGLDEQKADLVRAIEALDRLSGHLADQRAVIGKALDALGPGLAVLADQRAQLTAALTALGNLGEVGVRVVNQSRDDLLANLRALQPILTQLARAGDNLPKALGFMLSFPFPPNVTGAVVGDFVNLGATADLDAAAILSNLLIAPAPPAPGTAPPSAAQPGGKLPAPKGGSTRPGIPGVPAPPGLPGVPSLPGVLPLGCLPAVGPLLPGWTPPEGCKLPPGCALLAPTAAAPPGSIRPPGGVVPPGTVFPPGTLLLPGTILTKECLLPPATGAVNGQRGGVSNLLPGGLLP